MKQELYKITSGDNQFQVLIEYGDDLVVRLRIGGKTQCVFITFHQDEPQEANLISLTYDSECRLYVALERESHGTELLLKASMTFAVTKFPEIDYFVFQDKSTIDCMYTAAVALDTFYIAKHGKTWYMSRFGARPVTKANKAMLIRSLQAFDGMRIVEKNVREFVEKHVAPYKDEMQMKKSLRLKSIVYIGKELDKIWSTCETYRELFRKMMHLDCVIWDKWLDRFIVNALGFDTKTIGWKITKRRVLSWKSGVDFSKLRKEDAVGFAHMQIFSGGYSKTMS